MKSHLNFINDLDLRVNTLVIGLVDPLIDPGAIAQAINAAIGLLDSVTVAEFDSDPLYDYRAQRPVVTYVDGIIAELYEPGMSLDLVTDVQGERFLHIHGAEPDFHWPSLVADVLDIIERFGVERIYTYHGMPAPVAHTQPADMLIRTTQHVDNPSIVHGQVTHPASLSDVFEYEAGKAGKKVTNIRVRVPLYMSRSDMPFFSGAIAGVRQLAQLGGPTIPVGDLEQHEDVQAVELKRIQSTDSEFAQLVERFENDAKNSSSGFVQPDNSTIEIPSTEEIGEALEKFFSSQNLEQPKPATSKPKETVTPDRRSQFIAGLSRMFNRKSNEEDK
ncbi:MAG: PAC2 family protein [Actinomycetaceae bacterium]|nr:PAC2 family protein [Actinomycetaceae bacterium]